jgi:hypothetical protein
MKEQFDLSDRFHAHAYLAVGFSCDKCGAELLDTSSHPVPSDAWCVEIAANARMSGWRLPPSAADGTMDHFTAFCPTCAADRPDLIG